MKYLIAAIATVCLSAPAVLADSKSDVIGSSYAAARNKAEWVKVDSSCPRAGIGKQKLVLRCNATQRGAAMDINFKPVATKGFKQVEIYFKQLPNKPARFSAGLVFDGGGGQKRPLFFFDKCPVVKEGAYSKVTIDRSQLDFKDNIPLTQVITSFDSNENPNPSGAEIGALIVTTESGEVVPGNIELKIGMAPAEVDSKPAK